MTCELMMLENGKLKLLFLVAWNINNNMNLIHVRKRDDCGHSIREENMKSSVAIVQHVIPN